MQRAGSPAEKVVSCSRRRSQNQQEARTFLEGVFKAMELEVAIEMKYDKENDNLDVDFSGEDMGILIGKEDRL